MSEIDVRVVDIGEWEALSADQLPRLRQLTASIDGIDVGGVKLADRAICEMELSEQYPEVPTIYQLHVSETMRRRGIGSALMDRAERLAHNDGASRILLCVMPDNDAARHMYEGRGYVYIGDETVESVWHLKDQVKRVYLRPMIKQLRSGQ